MSAGSNTTPDDVYQSISSISARCSTRSLALTEQFLGELRKNWLKKLTNELLKMCKERSINPNGQERQANESKLIKSCWDNFEHLANTLQPYAPIFCTKDLLQLLLPKDQEAILPAPKRFLGHLDVKIAQTEELLARFAESIIEKPPKDAYVDGLIRQGGPRQLILRVLRSGHTNATWRPALWMHSLDISAKHLENRRYYLLHLRQHIVNTTSALDHLMLQDVRDYAAVASEYFVFESQIYQLLLCLAHDEQVLQLIAETDRSLPCSRIADFLYSPPMGIVPFAGISFYVAPFCFISPNPDNTYFVLRSMYTKHLYRLTMIEAHPQGIAALCVLFETLLERLDAQLNDYFRQKSLNPLHIVFDWLVYAFSGFLPSPQLLILWDMIIGFESLEILSLFAAALLTARRKELLKVTELKESIEIFEDLTTVKIRDVLTPILQPFADKEKDSLAM